MLLQYWIYIKLDYADRIAGATLHAPVINYWWPGFPANLSTDAYYKQPPGDQWALRVAHHIPWLTYWWNTQTFFPSSSVIVRKPELIFSSQDLEIFRNMKVSGRENNKVPLLWGSTFQILIKADKNNRTWSIL